ncbi:MAG: hypothetical protein JWO78_456 [Micavibrio sp.]|nr:hypothetical protein [Micavibrio sp.]
MSEAAKTAPGTITPQFNLPDPVTHREIKIDTFSIHDILDENNNCPVKLGNLQHLIHCQADLHMAKSVDDQARLKDLLKSRANTLRGFVLHGDTAGPLAYLVYYPMIDSKGSRVAYCEDFYIAESYRGHGAAKILFHELAKRTLADNFEYIQWATDSRNTPVHNFVQNKLGAKRPDVVTISANGLLGEKDNLLSQWAGKEYVTRPLRGNDVNLPEKLGLSPNIIRHTGDLDFKGFVTFEKGKPTVPVAITPGWIHLSTFQLKEGLHLEQPVFMANANKDGLMINEEGIVASIIDASKKFSTLKQLEYFRWHILGSASAMKTLLQDRLGLQRDSMLKGQPDTELIVYTLSNGALKKLSENEPDRTLRIPVSAPIGVRTTHVPAPPAQPGPSNDNS